MQKIRIAESLMAVTHTHTHTHTHRYVYIIKQILLIIQIKQD